MHEIIMLAGDTHGDLHQIKYLIEKATEHDATAIVVLGDFGFWEHHKSGIIFLDYIETKIAEHDIQLYFIDGNHENHTLLRRRYMGRFDIGRNTSSVELQLSEIEKLKGPWEPTCTEEGFYAVRKGLYYIPRASTWSWSNISFAALGGAHSIDVNRRVPGNSWWPEETIDLDEVELLKECGPVDIMLSHDVPIEVDIQAELILRARDFFKADQQTERNRKLLSKAVNYLQPSLLFHGHYHLSYTQEVVLENGHRMTARGLDMDGTGIRSFTILDLGDLEETNDRN